MVRFAVLSVGLVALLGCSSEASFSGSGRGDRAPAATPVVASPAPASQDATPSVEPVTNDRDVEKTTPPAEKPPEVPKTDVFALSFKQRKVDLVWVIDNSGSMVEEVAQVNANFAKFITGVANSGDVKVALLSKDIGPTAVTMPADAVAKGHAQFITNVGSTNLLAIAAAASCAAAETVIDLTLGTAQVCKQAITPPIVGGRPLEAPAEVFAAGARLKSFFRPGAARIYVFVTDDNAEGVTAANFVDMVTPTNEGRKPVIFAFRGIASTGVTCQIARPGLAYESLAQNTGGEVFDICLPDWSSQFAKLSQSVEKIANTQFDLSVPGAVIQSVSIDGVALPADKYKIEGGKLIVAQDAVSDKSKEIIVTYKKS